MPKDFKIGMFVGLVVVIGATLWLSVRPSLSTRASVLGPENTEAGQEIMEKTGLELNRLDSSSAETEIERKEAKDVEAPRYHIVQNGDTLSGISYQYYGSENKWQKILDANRNVIQDVRNLKPGSKLIIPE
jgi:nucleoid-associated protein YgaU